MTGFDIVVLVVVGLAAVFGFLRGFVHEVLSLAGWILALLAIRTFHTPLAAWLQTYLSAPAAASVLAFVLLALIPYLATKLLARWIGGATRKSLVGPVDRVLGGGFGAVKGLILVVLVFSLVVLGYDTVWGPEGRPEWLVLSRSYPLIDASSNALVEVIARRRQEARTTAARHRSHGEAGGRWSGAR